VDLDYPTGALTGRAVQAPVWFLIVHPGSRAQHLQMPNWRLNGRAQKFEAVVLDAFPNDLLEFRGYDDHRERE
jgi:hypothetical protein